MNKKKQTKKEKRQRRKVRIRVKIKGTGSRPRLSVFRSIRGMNVQLIDDVNSNTMLSVNSKKDIKDIKDVGDRKGKVAVAYTLGKMLAEKAKEKGIKEAVFDRSGYKYHGKVKAIADGARDNGLTI